MFQLSYGARAMQTDSQREKGGDGNQVWQTGCTQAMANT
jgi:hypothetical protein